MINKTGLPLLFRREGEGLEVAGQYEEHERARSLSPLLFSYIDQDSSFRCQARVGKHYQSSDEYTPLWCQPFTLENEITHRTLYLRQRGNEPERTFDIGISLKYGEGPFTLTKMISFVTKFQLENRTKHTLAFAQRHIVRGASTSMPENTITGLPGSVTLFHWPRSDLDHLLCLRICDSEKHCKWSGGFCIDREDSFHVTMRSALDNSCLFTRVEILLKGATYRVIVVDADQIPPPFKIVNTSDVDVTFWQDLSVDMSLRTILKAQESLMYALDEPVLKPNICVSVYQEACETYNLMKLSKDLARLYYQNAIYIAFTHTFPRYALYAYCFLNLYLHVS